MSRKIFKIALGIGIFGAGVIFGKVSKKNTPLTHQEYAGSLQIHVREGVPELYLALEVPPETLLELADVRLKVNKIA